MSICRRMPEIVIALLWQIIASAETDKPAIVQLTINTAYDDSKASFELISHLLHVIPPRTEKMERGESLTGLVLRLYGVSRFNSASASFLPQTAALLEQNILELNHVDKAEHLKAGQVSVPELPRKALRDFNPGKTANLFPSIAVRPCTQSLGTAPTTNADQCFFGPPLVSKVGRLATQSQQSILSLPATIARKVLADPVVGSHGTAMAVSMTARLADNASDTAMPVLDGTVTDHKVLTDLDRPAVDAALKSKAQRDVNLFILDTGWPDANEYSFSRKQLRGLISSIWSTAFGLAPPTFQPDPIFVASQNRHCVLINRSLKEFRELDVNSHIRVIYVPMTREQSADQLLIELIRTSYLIEFQKSRKLKDLSAISSDIVSTAKKTAEQVVKSLLRAWPSDSETVTTDKAVVDAILRVGEAGAEATSSVFFVNASWTAPHEQYFVAFPSPPRGLMVAAVGNFGSDAVLAETDFAQRCTNNTDTLAVMNVRPGSGLLCCSSRIPDQDINSALAVGFDGEVNGSDCASACGTSFAAPRVAWLLSAEEVLRNSTLDQQHWALNLKDRIFKLRNSGAAGIEKTWLDPMKFLAIN